MVLGLLLGLKLGVNQWEDTPTPASNSKGGASGRSMRRSLTHCTEHQKLTEPCVFELRVPVS